MKKLFFVILLSFFSLFFVSQPVATAKITDISSIMSQGSTRTCLHGEADSKTQPRKDKLVMVVTLNLSGKCISSTGCTIWLHNTENSNIEDTNNQIKTCKGPDASKHKYCDDPSKLDDKLAKEVEVKAGWQQITDFKMIDSSGLLSDPVTPGVVPGGDVSIQVFSQYAAHIEWSYYAIGDGQALPQEMGAGAGTPVSEQNASQQLGTVNNVGPTINLTQEGLQEDCITFFWDPFGRVFDSQSLEPMSGVEVTLLDSVGKPAVIDGPYNNYDLTKLDNGIYNILVSKEGDYQMSVDAPETHLFTRNIKLNSNYSTIYSDIYLPGDIFHEAPIPQSPPKDFDFSKYHHDIPLVAKKTPYSVPENEVYVIKSTVASADMGSFVNFKGRVTFPRAKICLVGKETKKVYGNCVNADKYGNFSINIEKNIVPQEYLYIISEKVNLTLPIIRSNNIDISKVNFQDENLTGYEPILNYVEGYTYDDSGKPMPKAKITVKLIDSDTVFYSTTADDTGFFTIYGKNLPFPEYYFEISDGKGGVPKVVTTSKFVEMNKSYLEGEKLNLMNSTKNNQPIINPTTGELNDDFKKVDLTKDNPTNTTKNTNFIKMLATIFIVFVLIVGALGTIIYIRKSHS